MPPAKPRRLVAGILAAGDAQFSVPPSPAVAAAPDTVVRAEVLDSVPDGAVAWRVLSHSTDLRGADTVVSGVVVAPDTPAPATGRTVVGWGHLTTGAVGRCAPSWGIAPFILIEGLLRLLDAGYVVVAPDYPGLGVTGASSYLIGTGEANSLLSIARPLVRGYLRSDPATTPPWSGFLSDNTPGAALGVPLFVAQGSADKLVVPSATQAYVDSACSRGEQVRFRTSPGATHGTIANTAVPDVLSFFASTLAGSPPASTC